MENLQRLFQNQGKKTHEDNEEFRNFHYYLPVVEKCLEKCLDVKL